MRVGHTIGKPLGVSTIANDRDAGLIFEQQPQG
jgi:hypothetical protein